VFLAGLTGTGVTSANDFGVWVGAPGDVQLLARNGDPAPGTAPGVHFASVSGQLNGNGLALVHGIIEGPGVGFANEQVLYAGRPGSLFLVARTGQPFDVGDGVMKTIAQNGLLFYGSGGEDGNYLGFNDSGQLAFLATFTDGTQGIFIATVPEPSSKLAVAAGGALLMGRRRRVKTKA
jgi:hypothetical protein